VFRLQYYFFGPTVNSIGFSVLILGLLVGCSSTRQHNSTWPPYSNAPADQIPRSTQGTNNNVNNNVNFICVNPYEYAGKVVGDGHCVSLIKDCSNAPDTVDWRPGQRVIEQSANTIQPGTVIATFKNDRYPNRRGYHAAIYIKHDKHGIWVWDQWRNKPVHKRLIRVRHDGSYASNSAQDYRVVMRKP